MYSVQESLTISTDKTSYRYGENYTISGRVSPVIPDQMISIVTLSPNYPHPVSLSFTPNSNGRYSYTLPLTINDISGGNFTVVAQYGGAKNQTTFSYTGLPCNQQNIPAHVYAPIIRGPPAYNPRIVDSLGNAITGPVKVGQQIQITYDLANGQHCAQPFVYIVQIQDHNGLTVSLSWITGTLLAGQSFNPAQSWTPQYEGTYTAQIFTWESLDNPNALVPPVSVSFDVEPNTNLKQSYLGLPRISSNCNEGFIHIIKKEDGSPACVKLDTAQKLVEHNWAKEVISNQQIVNNVIGNNTKLNHVIDIISISGTGSLPNPGGPEIQLTLKNVGTKPVTNLKATLVLNNNYTLDFKDVTESNPLESNQSTSDTQILIGAGFGTELAYPLIVVGMANNEPFSYTLNVPIPYTNEHEITNITK